MEFANAIKVYRKSGGSPTIAFLEPCYNKSFGTKN
jgi:hypothetical protein